MLSKHARICCFQVLLPITECHWSTYIGAGTVISEGYTFRALQRWQDPRRFSSPSFTPSWFWRCSKTATCMSLVPRPEYHRHRPEIEIDVVIFDSVSEAVSDAVPDIKHHVDYYGDKNRETNTGCKEKRKRCIYLYVVLEIWLHPRVNEKRFLQSD